MESTGQIVDLRLSAISNLAVGKIRGLHTESPQFENLYRSISKWGFNRAYPISVRPERDPVTKQIIDNKYTIVNGQHRHEIARRLGMPTIPAIIDIKISDEEASMWMYRLNEAVPTSLKEKHDYFKLFTQQHPEMSQIDIAELHSIDQSELSKILKFDRLIERAKKLVESGELPTTSALALATVPEEFQDQFLDKALTMNTAEFIAHISAHKKEIALAKRRGTDTVTEKVVPKLITPLEAKLKLEQAKRQLAECSVSNIEEYNRLIGRKEMIEEVLSIDPATIAYKESVKEADSLEKKLAAARKRNQEQNAKILEMERQKAELHQLEAIESIA